MMPTKLAPLYEHAMSFILHGEWTRLLAAADVYKNGAYPEYVPDEDMALRLYHLCASCPDAEVAGLGQSRYIELRMDPLPPEDRFGSRLPPDPGSMLISEATDRLSETPESEYQPPAASVRHHLSDAQNVHDHGVSSTVRMIIGKLLAKHGAMSSGRTTERATERARHIVLESNEPERTKMNALEVIDKMRVEVHSGFGVSDREVLALVFAEIDSLKDDELRTNVSDTLVKQISSGVEDDVVVCSSGKITRMIGAFDGTAAFDDAAKPMWAVREELGRLAARVMAECPEDTARDTFVAKAETEYVKRLGMSGNVMAPLIEEYAGAFA